MIFAALPVWGCSRAVDARTAGPHAEPSSSAGLGTPLEPDRFDGAPTAGREAQTAPPDVSPRAESIRAQLGPRAVEVVDHATRVLIGRLRVVGAEEAERTSLEDTNRVAGYPAEGDLTVLSREEALSLANLLLEPTSYAKGLRRCRNSYWIGLRFVRGDAKVEFALGMDCQQALWAFATEQGPKRFGETMAKEATDRVLRAASSSQRRQE